MSGSEWTIPGRHGSEIRTATQSSSWNTLRKAFRCRNKIWGLGDLGIWGFGDLEIWGFGDWGIWRLGDLLPEGLVGLFQLQL
ncbi:MAG TPA: hypothetical protein DET40_11850 [Lentisphaeria bacterium]|nr:hypothetical protein [Lentisphaeria bacterium]